MGIISEYQNSMTASQLEEILLDAVEGPYWSDARSAIKGFCKKKIWPLYLSSCEDSYGLNDVNPKLKEIFDK